MTLQNLLSEKNELLEKLKHNKDEVRRLVWMLRDNTELWKTQIIARNIQKGEALIDEQTAELKRYTVTNMARMLGVNKDTLFYQVKTSAFK